MGKIATGLFGGGSDAKSEAAKSRQLQAVANDRQLSQLNDADSRSGGSRRAPRGRRLLLADTSQGGLASTLGG